MAVCWRRHFRLKRELALAASPSLHVITDTMCATDHRAMKASPDKECGRDCVRDGKTFKYALADGKHVYPLSDQETPAKFAGRKVRVTGMLYTKTNILKVQRIDTSH